MMEIAVYFQIFTRQHVQLSYIVIGSEVFHWVRLEKPSLETEYNQVMDVYDERL